MAWARKARLVLLLSGLLIGGGRAPAEDLPTQGASFFDSLQALTGLVYDGKPLPAHPHPFETLLQRLNQHTTLYAAIVPYGRSLQKMAAYPHALKFPRVLVATGESSKTENTHLRGRLFLAYVEPAKKLEVISYNPLRGRFEFQVVDDFFPGGKAKSSYVPRALCLRCHQGGIPIFPEGEWLETTAFNAELLRLTRAAVGSTEYLGIPLNRDDSSSVYQAVAKPEHFEDMVRFGALLQGYQRAWQTLCAPSKDTLTCRRKLITWMLVTNLFERFAWEPDLELLRSFVTVLGRGSIDIPSEKLKDHNPIVQTQLSYHMPADADPSAPRGPMHMIMASDQDPLGLQFYKFYIFLRSMGQSFFTEQDFAHLRARLGGKVERLVQNQRVSTSGFAALKRDKDTICLPDPDSLMQGLNAPKGTRLAMEWNCLPRRPWLQLIGAIEKIALTPQDPLSRERILLQLDQLLGTTYAGKVCCYKQKPLGTERILRDKTLLQAEQVKDPRLQPLVRFCSECHLYQDLPPPFLAGSSEAEIVQNIRKRASLIQLRVRTEQMPPPYARSPMSAEDRRQFLETLKQIAP